ncbi:MAG: SLC13 family permease, partial [Lachnospiraceae bacterium]|nr:SLC13 family permease [Lachnospiraceae bacterium]
MLSALIIGSIAVSVAIGYKTKINTGFFAIMFAYLIGCFVMGMKAKEVIGGWPV